LIICVLPPQGAPVARLHAVEGSKPEAQAVGRTEVRPEPKVAVKSLADIVDLCAANRDAKLKAMTRNFVKLVRLEPGRLDVGLTENAPPTLLNELAIKLKEWTGIHWIVSLSKETAQQTMVEQEAAQHGARILDAKSDPDVAAILARFPGAKVTDVRIRAAELDEEETEIAPPAVAESDEGDILPGDDIEF
jgi:DNA polymerase III subunit gamma/tau